MREHVSYRAPNARHRLLIPENAHHNPSYANAAQESASTTPPSSLVLSSSSPLTSWFSRSRFSIRAANSASSFSVTALGAILTWQSPPAFVMLSLISTMACSKHAMPTVLSRHCDVRTAAVSECGDTYKASKHTVERRRHELDLDLVVGGVLRLGAPKGSLDGVDALVSEAGNCDSQSRCLQSVE
jgi:hypothetical protein